MSETSNVALKDRLKRLAEDEARTLGLSLSAPCWSLLERMLADGVQRMDRDQSAGRRDKVQRAADNVCLFVKQLAIQAKERVSFPVADEGAFIKAQIEGCPLWPFC